MTAATTLRCSSFEDVGISNSPEYMPYADEDQNELTFPDLDEEITPEAGDEYVHVSIIFSHGSQMMCGIDRAYKRDLLISRNGC